MSFNSLPFIGFFLVVSGLCWGLPPRWRPALLLLASYYFCASWHPAAAGLLAASTLLTYAAGVGMGRRATRPARQPWLAASLAGNLGLLGLFTCAGRLGALPAGAAGWWAWGRPVGLACYALQAVGYSLDVYRGHLPPERHLGRFALFLAFWPKLLAGPIARGEQLLPQLRQAPGFAYGRVASGLRLLAWGLFKKVVVADRLALMVDPVFGHVRSYQGLLLWLATSAFAWQLYADFSGYTDLARGAARVLGYELAPNFRQPYLAASVRDFWRRWHISFSSWLRDYAYRPLRGGRPGLARTGGSLLLLGLLGGLWHRASWPLLAWGALHGSYLALEATTRPTRARLARAAGLGARPRLRRLLAIAGTSLLVTYAWTFFRAQSLGDAWYVTTHLLTGWPTTGRQAARLVSQFLLAYPPEALVTAAVLMPLLAADLVQEWPALAGRWRHPPAPARWAAYAALLLATLLLSYFTGTPFYYLQF